MPVGRGDRRGEVGTTGGRGPRRHANSSRQQLQRGALDDARDVRGEGRRLAVAAMRDGRLVAAVRVLLGRGDVAEAALAVAGEDRHGGRRLRPDRRSRSLRRSRPARRRSRSRRCARPRSRRRWRSRGRRPPPGRASSRATRCGSGSGSWSILRLAPVRAGREVCLDAPPSSRSQLVDRRQLEQRQRHDPPGGPQDLRRLLVGEAAPVERDGRDRAPVGPLDLDSPRGSRRRWRARPRAPAAPRTLGRLRAPASSRNASSGSTSPAAPCRKTVTAARPRSSLDRRTQRPDEVRPGPRKSGPTTTGWQPNATRVAMASVPAARLECVHADRHDRIVEDAFAVPAQDRPTVVRSLAPVHRDARTSPTPPLTRAGASRPTASHAPPTHTRSGSESQ